MNINNIDYMKLVNQRNALVKENKRLKQALKIKNVLWKDGKQYVETNGKGKIITDMVVHNG